MSSKKTKPDFEIRKFSQFVCEGDKKPYEGVAVYDSEGVLLHIGDEASADEHVKVRREKKAKETE